MARFNTDGSLDPTVGTGGRFVQNLDQNPGRFQSALLQADGKILLVGTTPRQNASSPQLTIGRLNTDGNLDLTFGGNGFAPLGVSSWGTSEAGVPYSAG